jgi:hypothetical protein
MRLLLLDYRASILVELPEAACLTAVTVWLVMQIAMPFLVFAFLGNLPKSSVSFNTEDLEPIRKESPS